MTGLYICQAGLEDNWPCCKLETWNKGERDRMCVCCRGERWRCNELSFRPVFTLLEMSIYIVLTYRHLLVHSCR